MAHEMAVGGDSVTRLVNFFLVDSTRPWFKDDKSDGRPDPLRAQLLLNPIDTTGVVSLKDLVNKVASKCQNGTKVGVLRIGAHGGAVRNADPRHRGFTIGRDGIWTGSISKYYADLAKLNNYLVPGVSHVILDSCTVGEDIYFLSTLSMIWNGVAVTGFEEKQSPQHLPWLEPKGEGPSVTCEYFLRNQCTMDIGRY